MKENELVLGLQTDKAGVTKEGPVERVVEIEIQAPVAKDADQRQPLNLALVLDRSGSMYGDRLEFAKLAALHVTDLLEDDDHLAVIIYDDEVMALSESMPMTPPNRRRIKEMLHNVQSGGSTNLSGGWLAGCQMVARQAQENTINRVLLLSDGQANVGITDPEELAVHARELASRGIATSTFGVGLGFNEQLMETMSNQGQGNFYFIESPTEIPVIFASEFKELSAITAKEVELRLELPAGATCKVYGGYHTRKKGKMLVIPVGSMYSGKSQMIYLKATIPAAASDTTLAIKASVYARGEEGQLLEAAAELALPVLAKADLDKIVPNLPMMQRFSVLELAEAAKAALELERQGRYKEASSTLYQSVNDNMAFLNQRTRDLYTHRAEQMKAPMSEMDRKSTHYDSYRQMRMQQRGLAAFPLEAVAGYLVVRVERFKDVLDTGSPVSIGGIPKFLFMGEMYPLLKDYQGVDIQAISQQIGKGVDAMLGMDVLKNYHILINLQQNQAVFSNVRIDEIQGERAKMEAVMGIPVISVPVNNTALNLFLDTGSPLNYLSSDLVKGLQEVDTARDTYPGFGEFSTPIYELPVTIAGKTLPFRFGVLPELLEKALLLSGVRGILGTELFDHFKVQMSFPDRTVEFEPFVS
ncbi:MAG: VWA domain-containing protein [Anaerolineaceae bacterium]|nr:VWA domain-containing protein [Anaerolineaceae bacterium]